MVAQGDGKFTPVDVEVGLDSNGQTEIRKGLQLGQKVVVSGQFLVDSEANLKASTTRMGEMPAPAAAHGPDATHRGEGKVESIGKEEITISQGPIASLQWGPMTMGFKLPAAGLPQGIGVGNSVNFEIRQTKDGTFQITSIAPARTNSEAPPDTAANGVITKPRDKASSGAKP